MVFRSLRTLPSSSVFPETEIARRSGRLLWLRNLRSTAAVVSAAFPRTGRQVRIRGFLYPATVTAGTVDGATVYSLSLRFPVPDPRDSYRFMVLANLTDDEFAGAAGPDGSNFKAANGTADPMGNDPHGHYLCTAGNWPLRPFRSFPMWGESGVFTGTSHTVGSVSMVRSVARIDVGVNFQRNPDGSYPLDNMVSQGIDGLKFRVTSVKLYNVPEKGVIGPAAANYSESGRYVTARRYPETRRFPPAPGLHAVHLHSGRFGLSVRLYAKAVTDPHALCAGGRQSRDFG